MSGTRIGVYPGTFDPITNGHMDIIRRSMHVVDRLVIGIAVNTGKGPLFSLDERMAMVEKDVAANDAGLAARVDIRPLDNLLMDFVVQNGGTLIVRGLRAARGYTGIQNGISAFSLVINMFLLRSDICCICV